MVPSSDQLSDESKPIKFEVLEELFTNILNWFVLPGLSVSGVVKNDWFPVWKVELFVAEELFVPVIPDPSIFPTRVDVVQLSGLE